MQGQQDKEAAIGPTEDDVLMNSPFTMDGPFTKACGNNASLLTNILQGDNRDDWTNMDCDEGDDHGHHHHHRLVRGAGGMASHDSTGSLDSASSTSSTPEYEPELSQSFGSTRSYDLMTPIKPSLRTGSGIEPLQQYTFAKASPSIAGLEGRTSVPNSPRTFPSPTSQLPSSYLTDDANARHLHQQRHNLGESLGLKLDTQAEATSTGTVRSNRPAAPGLAGRLKINLPTNSFSSSHAPLTPGGHIAVGARDGAATGGPPLSPFEPPTPLQAPTDSPFSVVCSPKNPTVRPKLQQRHTITPTRNEPSGFLGMSPITSQFAAVSMRKTSSSKGSTSDVSMQQADHSDTSSATSTSPSTSTLITPPYSPFGSSKGLPSELDVPSAPLERKTSASSSTSSAAGTGSAAKKRNDNVRSSVSSRSVGKSIKSNNKVSPYPLPRDDCQAKQTNATPTSATPDQRLSSSLFTPTRAEESNSPSLLRDIVKPAMVAPAMEKSVSEPSPKTVSARHLAHRTLHPTFTANYSLGDELGSGGFGFVVSATRDRDGMPVAVKFIFKDKVPTHGWVRDEEFGAIPMEAFVLKVVDSPFVVKFVDLFDDDQFFYLVMEHHGTPWKAPGSEVKAGNGSKAVIDEGVSMDKLIKVAIPTSIAMKTSQSQPNPAPLPSPTFAVFPPEGEVAMQAESAQAAKKIDNDALAAPGPARPVAMERRSSCDLFECIEQHSRLSEDKARWVFAQIVEAVYYLDRRGICHRDIKDENCVIDNEFNVKLIDFGSAVITDPRRPTPYFNRFFGTMTFASSEILQGKQYRAPNAEVWSLGVLLSILLSGECPFADPTAAIRGKICKPNGSWSAEAFNLLSACLVVNPDKRATIGQIRQHPWVAKAWTLRGRKRPEEEMFINSCSSTA